MLNIPDEIKELLHQDSCKKNIRIHFPNGERSDICNDLIVMDSVKFTESLCSQNELKFGLCESPMFECEVVGVGNIKGATIEVFCEIFCPASVEGAVFRPDLQEYVYPLPYGKFDVQECKRQADMNHRKIQAYSNTYNSLDFDISKSVAASMATYRATSDHIQVSTYWEDMIYETYPEWFDKEAYEYNEYVIADLREGQSIYTLPSALMDIIDDGVQYRLTIIPRRRELHRAGTGSRYFVVDCEDIGTSPSFEAECQALIDWLHETFPNAQAYKSYIRRQKVDMEAYLHEVFSNFPMKVAFRCGSSPAKIVSFREGRVVAASYDSSTSSSLLFVNLGLENASFNVNLRRNNTEIQEWEITQIDDESKIYTVPTGQMTRHALSFSRTIAYPGNESPYNFEEVYYSTDWKSAMIALTEIKGDFLSVSRNRIKDINIKRQFGLNPGEELYPGSALYPQSVTGGKLLPQDYQSCWYEDEYTLPYGAIECAYKDNNSNDAVFKLFLNGFDEETDPNTYKVYNLTDNYYIRYYTWTAAQIQTICEQLAESIEGVSYMPVDFVGRGLPYVEAGDTFEILTKSNDSITTIVLNRTISGEQVLTDSYKSV